MEKVLGSGMSIDLLPYECQTRGMARKPRIDFPGAFFHFVVLSRVNHEGINGDILNFRAGTDFTFRRPQPPPRHSCPACPEQVEGSRPMAVAVSF
jgi:hypothetical protein